MKKRWRDQAKDKERLSVTIGVVEREPGQFYGIVPLEWMRSLSSDPTSLDRLLADFGTKVPGLKIERDGQGSPQAVLGPTDARIAAEAFATSFVQMICDELGVTREGGPELRPAGEGFFADFNASSRTNPKRLGDAPDDLRERLLRADKLLTSSEDDVLTLMLAAWTKLKTGKTPHPLEFVTLARAVVAWSPVGEVPQTELGVLEARARSLAHLIAENISPADQFVLLLCNTGESGQCTHIGSMDRATIIEVVGEFVQHLRDDAARLQ